MKSLRAIIISSALIFSGVPCFSATETVGANRQAQAVAIKAMQLMAAGHLQDAIRSFDDALSLDDTDSSIIYNAGVAHQGYANFTSSPAEYQQELLKAETLFEKAISLKPDYFDARIHAANVQSSLQKYLKSLDNLKAALLIEGVSEANKLQTQQAIAYVTSRLQVSGTVDSVQEAAQSDVGPERTHNWQPDQQKSGNASLSAPAQTMKEPVHLAHQQPESAPNMVHAARLIAGYTNFTDPSERSFHVQVPVGWKTEGGLTRASAIDCRPWIKVTSPDNLIVAFIGDGSICPSTMPTPSLTALGFRTGSKYMGGQILPYIPARQFVEKYAFLKLKQFSNDLQVVAEGDHPDIAYAVNGSVGCTKSECASIKMTGTILNIPAVAYYLAATKATIQSGTGMWWVTYIAGEVSPADREPEGLAVLLHMMKTFRLDPDWQRQSLQTTAAVSANYRASANAISKSISDRYWNQQAFNDRMNNAYWKQQAAQDRAAENFSDYIRDQQQVSDPQTGYQYKVPTANEHYIDQQGNIYGINDGPPAPDWRQLINVP